MFYLKFETRLKELTKILSLTKKLNDLQIVVNDCDFTVNNSNIA